MAYRLKARSTTSGEYRLAPGTLANLTSLDDIVSTAYRGDGGQGTLNMGLYTLLSGVVASSDVRLGVECYTDGPTGMVHVPNEIDVRQGVQTDVSSYGLIELPDPIDVRSQTNYDAIGTDNQQTGTCIVPAAPTVLIGYQTGAEDGLVLLPDPGDVRLGQEYGVPDLRNPPHYLSVGTLITGGGDGTFPAEAYVHADAGTYGPTGTEYIPSLSALTNWTLISGVAVAGDVRLNVPRYTGGPTGTYDPVTGNYTDPGIASVKDGTVYKFAGADLVGTLIVTASAYPRQLSSAASYPRTL